MPLYRHFAKNLVQMIMYACRCITIRLKQRSEGDVPVPMLDTSFKNHKVVIDPYLYTTLRLKTRTYLFFFLACTALVYVSK